MNEKSQYVAEMRRVVRWDERKHSVSTVVAHKNLATFTGHCGRKFPKAFCAFGTLLPTGLQVGFQFGGQNEMKDCSPFEQTLLRNC
jgi:hypothetical protein